MKIELRDHVAKSGPDGTPIEYFDQRFLFIDMGKGFKMWGIVPNHGKHISMSYPCGDVFKARVKDEVDKLLAEEGKKSEVINSPIEINTDEENDDE